MKLATEAETTTVSEEVPSYSFGIRSLDMGLVIEVLRSKMYTNPIRIICQEIAANARDANREAGNKNSPIKIRFDQNFFNNKGCSIVIEDDGPGISPERMTEIFINYGASTKRHTNTQTGGFGLGCKTPFAYTDTFTILTKVDGVKYTYQAVIEKNRTGKIYLLFQEPTSDPNGTAIIIPVGEYEKNTFIKECHRATLFWNPRPVLDPAFITPLPALKKHEDSFIIDTGFCGLYAAGIYALVDDIPYFFNNNDSFNKIAIFLRFKTGELSISANRETLHMDNETEEKITKRYKSFVASYTKAVFEEIDKAPTYYHAAILYSACSDNPIVMECCEDPKWNGIPIKTDFNDLFHFLRLKKGTHLESVYQIPADFLVVPKYINDAKSFHKARFNEAALKHPDSKPYLIYATGGSEEEKEKSLIALLNTCGKTEFLSSIRIQKKSCSIREKRNTLVYHCSTGWHSRNPISPQRIDSTAKGYYIPFKFKRDLTQEQMYWGRNISAISKENVYFVKGHSITAYPNLLPLSVAEKKYEEQFKNQARSGVFKKHGLDLKLLRKLNFPKEIKKLIGPDVADDFVINEKMLAKYITEQEKIEIKGILTTYPLLTYYNGPHTEEFNKYIQVNYRQDKPAALDLNP
jgi:anti-sigma regulatory factor (Ser/Thr protein kinase)